MTAELPWRGPGPDRPELPLPPGPMPLFRAGRPRKRWRYVGVYGERLMLCAASIEIGPLGNSFWAVWDREHRRRFEHTRLRPGGGEVEFDGDVLRIDAADLSGELTLGGGAAIESMCPSGKRGYGWTRKLAGVRVTGAIELDGREIEVDALGVDDVSAGYQARHVAWNWSAGVGSAAGRTVAWNLVTGINDPPRSSERAIWVDGEPSEPAPVRFDGLDAVEFADGERLEFEGESERARNDNLLVVRSRYRHVFGAFSGSLPGIGELDSGLGVMEEHDARW